MFTTISRHEDDPEDERHDERRRVDARSNPGADPAERAERLSLAAPFEHHPSTVSETSRPRTTVAA